MIINTTNYEFSQKKKNKFAHVLNPFYIGWEGIRISKMWEDILDLAWQMYDPQQCPLG